MSINVNGLKQIEANLKKLALKESKVRDKAVQKAAEEVARQLERNTPVEPNYNGKHMKDDVQVGKVDEDGHITVGYGKDTSWRAHFVEMGTIKQPPQGFIQQTEDQMKKRIIDIMKKEIQRGLGL